jgi:hypothetical protein
MKFNIKQITYSAIFILIAALTFQSYRLSVKENKLKDVSSKLTLLEYTLSNKKDSINLLEYQAKLLTAKSDSLNKEVLKLKKYNTVLNNKLDSALSSIDSIPPDSSYIFLKDSAYKYSGDLIYPFNGKQITEIHKDFVENIILNKININLDSTINLISSQIVAKDNLINNQLIQINTYKGMIKSLDDIVNINKGEINKLNKDVIKQKRVKYLLQGISVAEGIFILISIL